jgi:23S rRNA pseudouridine1911/1915/1917 synthase
VLDRKSFKVKAGSTLRVELAKDEKPLEIVAQDLPLDVLYEDEHMVVLNKAAGMVVHPAAGNWDGTVVNALAYYLAKSPYGSGDFVGNDDKASDELNSISNNDINPAGADGEPVSFRPGIVHRLDKGTTGVLVVAKTTQSLATLSGSFAARNVKKTYLAVTVGNPGKRVAIDKPIGRHPVHRQRMRVVPDPHKRDSSGMAPKDRILSPSKGGRRALSYVDTLHFDQKLSMVQVRIETGRTHQIRVHLQDRHTPIYGDDVYGIADWNKRLFKTHGIDRPLLHAYRLEIDHPVTGERMVFIAPMAEDMKMIAQTVWPGGPEELPEIFA